MNFNNYLFRAHSIGNIMTGIPKPLTERQSQTFKDLEDRHEKHIGKALTEKQLLTFLQLKEKKNAKCKLSDGAKTFLDKLIWQELTGRSNKINSKYLDKGLMTEEKSITLLSEVEGKLFIKNKERKTNEFFQGECDNAQKKIRDVKSSFEFETFPIAKKEIESKLYVWQLEVYMDLWEMNESELIYCLNDTPFKLIDDELRRLDWKSNIFDLTGNIREESIDLVVETIMNHIYTFQGLEDYCDFNDNIQIKWFEDKFKEIPVELRIKKYKLTQDKLRNSQLKEMVSLARDYMNSQLEALGDAIIDLKK